jgi:hypothetical protein
MATVCKTDTCDTSTACDECQDVGLSRQCEVQSVKSSMLFGSTACMLDKDGSDAQVHQAHVKGKVGGFH